MEKNTVKRVTKAMTYEDIIALLQGDPVKYNTTVDTAVQFINHEMELLARKNSGESKKLTATQEANVGYREAIYNFLCTQADPLTCTEIQANVPELADFNNQKVAALVKRLCDDGRIRKGTNKKGRSVFSVA